MPTPDGIFCTVRAVAVDPVGGVARVRFDFFPTGDYVVPNSKYRLAQAVQLTAYSRQPCSCVGTLFPYPLKPRLIPLFFSQNLPGQHYHPHTELSLTMFDGDVLRYPFDVHHIEAPLTALTLQAGSNTSFEAVPIGVLVAGGVATYTLIPDHEVLYLCELHRAGFDKRVHCDRAKHDYQVFRDCPGNRACGELAKTLTLVFFSIAYLRGPQSRILALSRVAIVLDKLFFHPMRKVETGQLNVGTGILFALPGIRTAMPSVPPAGTVLDTATFFWFVVSTSSLLVIYPESDRSLLFLRTRCEVIVAFCVAIQLWPWMLAYQPPKPAKEEKPKAETVVAAAFEAPTWSTMVSVDPTLAKTADTK